MKRKLMQIPVPNVKEGVNVRINYALAGLIADIADNGLKTPILVWRPDSSVKDQYEVLQGHRRTRAINALSNLNPEAFQAHFSEGIPAIVVEGITENEALELKVDHGNELGLTDPYELLQCAILLFKAGHPENRVANDLAILMDRISPMKPKDRQGLETLQMALSAAEASKDANKVAEIKKGMEEAIFQYRRGMVQYLHNTARCPEIVMAALYKKATNANPEGFEDQYLPDLSQTNVKDLWKCHKSDLEIMENGVSKFSQQRPGPEFNKKWAAIIKAEKDAKAASETGAKRAKAMSASSMDKDIKEGKFASILAKKMTLYHQGKDVTGLTDDDRNAYYAELVRDHNPKEWAKIVEMARGIEGEIKAADQAAAKAAAESDPTE